MKGIIAMFQVTPKRIAATAAFGLMFVVGSGSTALAHGNEGSKGTRGAHAGAHPAGSRASLTAAQEACLTANGHVHPSQSVPYVKDASHKTANDAAYAACGIAKSDGADKPTK